MIMNVLGQWRENVLPPALVRAVQSDVRAAAVPGGPPADPTRPVAVGPRAGGRAGPAGRRSPGRPRRPPGERRLRSPENGAAAGVRRPDRQARPAVGPAGRGRRHGYDLRPDRPARHDAQARGIGRRRGHGPGRHDRGSVDCRCRHRLLPPRPQPYRPPVGRSGHRQRRPVERLAAGDGTGARD